VIDPSIGVSIVEQRITDGGPAYAGFVPCGRPAYTITVTERERLSWQCRSIGEYTTFALPEPVAVGDVVINEMLYDPRVGWLRLRGAVQQKRQGAQPARTGGSPNEEDGNIANSTIITLSVRAAVARRVHRHHRKCREHRPGISAGAR
jgi:hypothetical protein